MKVARLADGTELRFPDETPDEVVTAAVKKHLSGGAAPQGKEGLGGWMKRQAGEFASPAWEAAKGAGNALLGAAQLPGAISDLTQSDSRLGQVAKAANLPFAAGKGFADLAMDDSSANVQEEMARPRSGMQNVAGKFGPDIGKYIRSAIGAVPLIGKSALNMTSKAAEGNFAGAAGEGLLLAGPQALRGPARALKVGAEETARLATGPVRSIMREAGFEPTNVFNPLAGVSGDVGKGMSKLRNIADEELGALGIDRPLGQEVTTPGALQKNIRSLIDEQNVRHADDATFKQTALWGAKERALTDVESRLGQESANFESRVPEIQARGREALASIPSPVSRKAAKAGVSVGAEGAVNDALGTRSISSARAGRVAEPAIRESAEAAQKQFGDALSDAEAPLSDVQIPRSKLLEATKDFEPELSTGAAYLRKKLTGGEDAASTIPFSEIRIANKRLGPMRDLLAKGASREAETAAFGEMPPGAVNTFKQAKTAYNENVAAPYRRGAPGKALDALKKELPQEVTNIPLDAVEQWGQLVKSVEGNPLALKAVQSDVVFNRMGLSEGASTFAKNWRQTPRATRVRIYGKTSTSAMDRFLDTIEDLERGAVDTAEVTNAGNKALRGEVRRNFANELSADRASTSEARGALSSAGKALKLEVASNFDAQIAAVKPKQVGTTPRLQALEEGLNQMRPRGFSVDPHLNLWAQNPLTVRVVDIMGHLIGAGNTGAALSFANAFDNFTKTGRPQMLISSVAAIQRREVRDRKREKQQ